jgi:hypothetical protein
MTLPTLPPGEGQQLLQTIWDLAFQTYAWPMFAELDHRWDSSHDSDVLDVLRELPPGLVNGADLHTQPQSTTRICLTVAGAATCRGAEETLKIFLDFIRVATSIEQGWLPRPDQPDAVPTLTDAEYVSQSRALPAAGRPYLLQLLFQLIKTETSVWDGLHGPDDEGHWQVSFGRKIRTFRSVNNLDEYWNKRYKSWEPAVEPSASPQPNLMMDDQAAQDVVLNANPAVLDAFLLDQVYSTADGSLTKIVVCTELRPSIDVWKIEESLRRIEAQGAIQLQWLDPAPAPPRAMLTGIGVLRVETSRQQWGSRVFRDRAARNAILAWLHDQGEDPQGSILLAKFRLDARSAVEGRFFSAADLDAAAAYLCDKGLVEGMAFVSGRRGPLRIRITVNGIDCMEQGGDVAEYLSPRQSGVTYNFNAPVSGTNIAMGDHATQHASVSGIDADNLTTLVRAIVEALPTLGLGAGELKEAQDAASQVSTEIVQQKPDPSSIRTALSKVRGYIASAGQQALGAVLTATIDYELKKLGLP